MTALAANSPHIRTAERARYRSYIVASGSTVYANSFVGLNTSGLLVPWADTAGFKFLGMARSKVTGSSALERCEVDVSGCYLNNVDVAGVTARTDLDDVLVYCADDNPATLSTTATVNVPAIGRLVDFRSTSDMDVQLVTSVEAGLASGRVTQWAFPMTLALLANGNIVTGFVPGFAGRILSLQTVNTAIVTTAAKAASLNAEIDTVDVTGGVVALTSANQTPLGARVAGSAVTAANKFSATSAIDIEASSVTTFVEGEAVLYVTVVAD